MRWENEKTDYIKRTFGIPDGDCDWKYHLSSHIFWLGSEIYAVALQTLLCGLLGTAFGICSLIWEIDKWSIAKQTGIYFLSASFIMMPIAYLTNWMEHTLVGFVIYFGVFAAIFVIVWIVQYFIWRVKIKKMNARIKEQ